MATILGARLQRVTPTFLGRVCNASRLGYFLLLLGTAACSYTQERGKEPATAETPAASPESAPATTPTFAVYLENSGSMDGYVRGVTAFEDDVYQLLVDLGYAADTLSLFYINSQPIPYAAGTEQFISKLEPAEFQQRGGNRSNSDLNQIFSQLLRQTTGQRATLLISDFILSLGKGSTEDLLNNQRISIYNTFRQQLEKQPLGTYIVKMQSDFTGNYYTKDDRPVYLTGVRRPYYLWFIGPAATIRALPAIAKVEQLPGFANSYALLPVSDDHAFAPFYTVLNNTFKQGSFRTDRAASGRTATGQDYVHGLEKVQASRRGEPSGTFGFSVAVDLSGVTADASYLTDPDNYEVRGYQLDTVLTLDAVNMLHPRDRSLAEGVATHVLAFSTTQRSYSDLQVALQRQTPAWVAQTSTDDDTAIKNNEAAHDQTFGFRYLVAGVEEAYRKVYGQAPHFTLTVSVNP
ncbi:MAG: hypothetical protein WA960_21415 [Tunicatimonas sp.]